MTKDDPQTVIAQAEQIVRSHDLRCIGEYTDEAWCSAAPNGQPLCTSCQVLANTIAEALARLTAREPQVCASCQWLRAGVLSGDDLCGHESEAHPLHWMKPIVAATDKFGCSMWQARSASSSSRGEG